MPFVLGLDGFTGAGLTLLQGRVFDTGGLLWEVLQGSFVVQGGMCRVNSTLPTKSVAIVGSLDPRNYLGAKISFRSTIDNKLGIVARVQPDGASYYLAYFSRPYVHLFRVDSGVSTWLALYDATAVLTDPATMELRCQGPLCEVRWNGSLIITQADATYATGGAGIQITEPFQWIDSFELEVDGGTTTVPPTTVIGPTTVPPTTVPTPTTPPPTTILSPELTFPPTTLPGPTTLPPTTPAPTTVPPPTTIAGPTTVPPTTIPITTGERIRASFCYVEAEDRLIVNAWLVNDDEVTNTEVLDPALCTLDLVDEFGVALSFTGVPSPAAAWEVRFVIPQVRLYAEHLYLTRISLFVLGEPPAKGPAVFALPVT